MTLRFYEPRARGTGSGRSGTKPMIKFSTMSMVINLAARKLLPEGTERIKMGFDPDSNSIVVAPAESGGSVIRKSKVHAAGMMKLWGLKWLAGQRIPVELENGVLVGYPAPPEREEAGGEDVDVPEEESEEDETEEEVARRYGGVVIERSA